MPHSRLCLRLLDNSFFQVFYPSCPRKSVDVGAILHKHDQKVSPERPIGQDQGLDKAQRWLALPTSPSGYMGTHSHQSNRSDRLTVPSSSDAPGVRRARSENRNQSGRPEKLRGKSDVVSGSLPQGDVPTITIERRDGRCWREGEGNGDRKDDNRDSCD
jgi:hypothetical protein